MTDKDRRITLALRPNQHDWLNMIADKLDVDQGKALRWMMKTCQEIADPDFDSSPIRNQLSPPAKYLLDTITTTLIEN